MILINKLRTKALIRLQADLGLFGKNRKQVFSRQGHIYTGGFAKVQQPANVQKKGIIR